MQIKTKIFFFHEVVADLFTVRDDYALAHCVGADFLMGVGIALEFEKRFGQVDVLKTQNVEPGGVAVLKVNSRYIYYLVTKKSSYGKPSYRDFYLSLCALKNHMVMRTNSKNNLFIHEITNLSLLLSLF